MITKESKLETVKKFGSGPADTGNTGVQIALLTDKIAALSAHLKGHKKDYATQLGLLRLVGQRRRLLAYLKKSDVKAYATILKQLELRK